MTESRYRANRIIEHRVVRGSDLRPNPDNWRVHPQDQRDTMEALLDRVGYIAEAMAVETPDGLMLLDGHLRAEIGQDDEIPVAIVDLAPDEQRLVVAVFDPLAAMAETDREMYGRLADQVESDEETISALLRAVAGGEMKPLAATREETFDAGKAMEEAEAGTFDSFTKRGQVWQLGDHRLMCGNGPIDHRRFLEEHHVNLVLTDPPYGIGIVKRGQVHQDGGRGGSVAPNRKYAPVHGDDEAFDPTWLTGVGDNQIIFGGAYFLDKLASRTCWLCWDKGVEADWSSSGFELAWTSFEGHYRIYRHMWSGMIRKGPRVEELKDRVHPTQKPVGLFAEILTTFTSEGDVVFDPYLGSGTTLIAAEKLGRPCYSMEIEPQYCDVAIRRWEDYTGHKAQLVTE